jgi:nucleoside-triphosphatase THEP1
MKIAYTMTEGKGDLDLVLYRFAKAEMARGTKVVGVVQINSDREDCALCDMDVEVLPDGPTIRISQDLGREAKGCRLDPEALETAVSVVGAKLTSEADLLVLNKFGKHEASGRGFRDTIGQAMALGVPVLCGVNALNREAFETFSGGTAEYVAPTPEALSEWFTR